MPYSILEITDGTTTVSLVSLNFGLHLKEWDPAIPPFKDGGTFQSSSLAPGRRLVAAEYDNAQETFVLAVNGKNQDTTIGKIQDFLRLLLQGINYWKSEGGQPVYIRAKSPCETGIRYALLHSFSIPNIDNPYAAPFFVARKLASMDEIELSFERGHWLANAPGTGECVEIGNVTSWQYLGRWALLENSGSGTSEFKTIIQLSTGTVLAGGDITLVRRSTNGGAAWTTPDPSLAGDDVLCFLELASGKILLGAQSGKTRISTDDGATWSAGGSAGATSHIQAMVQALTGQVIAHTATGMKISSDEGASWSALPVTVSSVPGAFVPMVKTNNGDIYALFDNCIHRSTDAGSNWTAEFCGLTIRNLLCVDDVPMAIRTVVSGTDTIVKLIKRNSTTTTWEEVADIAGPESGLGASGRPFGANGVIFAFINGAPSPVNRMYKSIDSGLTWTLFKSRSGASPDIYYGGMIDSDGNYWLLDNEEIYKFDTTSTEMGAEEDCGEGATYITNKVNVANLTHIKLYDASEATYTDMFPMATFPQNLTPATAGSDYLYFGVDTTIDNTGPFNSLIFDILHNNLRGNTLFTTTGLEYYNGGWVALDDTDNTGPGGLFSIPGPVSYHWAQPSDWTTTTVHGITGYWVRLPVSGSGSMTAITQQNRQIYAANKAYFEIQAAQVVGDIPALAQFKLTNQSDLDGRGGSTPDLWSNRYIIGLRTIGEGSLFSAFINISDEQNPDGITVTAGTNTAFANDLTAPTGRRATFNSAGVEAMTTRVTIALGPSLARDYYGTFHAYLRGRRTSGASTDFSIQLQIVTGSGGIAFTSETQQFSTTTAFELLDFGQITIPASGSIKPDELSDTLEIRIQADSANGTPDIYFYDVILIPVDEWGIDAADFSNTTSSIVGRADTDTRFMDVDSITYPLLDIRSTVRKLNANEVIVSVYNSPSNGEAILQNGQRQQVWVLCAQTSATGADPTWIAHPDISHSVRVYKNERYLALRGDE